MHAQDKEGGHHSSWFWRGFCWELEGKRRIHPMLFVVHVFLKMFKGYVINIFTKYYKKGIYGSI